MVRGTEEQALGIHPRGRDSVYRMASWFFLLRPSTSHLWLPLGNQARICCRKRPFKPRSAPPGGASCPWAPSKALVAVSFGVEKD